MDPIVASSIFVLVIMVLCFIRPNAGRIVIGLFFILMALAVNGSFILTSPHSYADYARMSYWPLYREVALWVVSLLGPVAFGLLLAAYELVVAGLLLSKRQAVKVGLAGVIVFIVGITPLSTLQIPWLGLAVAAAFLLRHDYPRALFAQSRRDLIGVQGSSL